ncbi:hypothetical protein TWF696_003252 [Orbilia brochopaga]|uniref:Asteroid domain-containing protein n=1 Tax=Orbilia brochopaga TaxID=3140254 RepID=A0AAV9U1P8_9PEZI
MGIPHLLSTLEKLRRPASRSFSSDGGREQLPAAVIDGSALAHFIFNCCVKTFRDRTADVLAFDYAAYQRAVVRWLEDLEAGFTITHIFIDGHLPSYKTDTRTSRVQKAVTDLARLRTLSPAAIDLRKSPWTPTPPFLIAAFTDAVYCHERYRHVVRTVPGEADAFCAGAASEYQGGEAVIFTADSDLLVYPSKPHVRIAMLGDMAFEDAEDGRTVKVTLWTPAEIDALLGGDGNLLRFAWVLHHDSLRAAHITSTFPSAAASVVKERGKVLGGVLVPPVFQEQYTLPPRELYFSSTDDTPPVILDSRAAEVVYRSRSFSSLAHPRSKEADVTVYLPVLFEDVTKKSAWNVGLRVRKLAYSILFDNSTMLSEACRKAAGVTHRYINLSTTADAGKLADEVAAVPTLGDTRAVLVYVVSQVIIEHSQAGSPLEKTDILALLAAITHSPSLFEIPAIPTEEWTWPRVQLLAQVYAGLWSMYLLSVATTVTGNTDSELQQRLAAMPKMVEALNVRRFMAVYAIMPRVGKKARKRARKRVKTGEGDEGDDLGRVVGRLFREGDIQGVLEILGGQEGGSGDSADDGSGGEDEYMGMTVG